MRKPVTKSLSRWSVELKVPLMQLMLALRTKDGIADLRDRSRLTEVEAWRIANEAKRSTW